jgi:hypothetical protein
MPHDEVSENGTGFVSYSVVFRQPAIQEFTAEALRTQRKNYGAKPMPVHSLPMVIIERGNKRE